MSSKLKIRIEDDKFQKQNEFIDDTSKLKAALCTRRSGKSFGAGRYLLKVANDFPGVKCLYIALTRDSAKNIMWDDVLKVLVNKYAMVAKTNEVDLSMTLSNKSTIRLVGADAKPAEMEKFLGQKYKLVIIDEAGSFRQDLRRLVYEIIEPACVDLDGSVAMIGTPTDLVKSLFYDVTTRKEGGWSVHKWSTMDNPYIAEKWDKKIKDQIARDPKIIETPAFKRMYLGEWFIDTDKLVYKFNRAVNVFSDLPKTHKTEWYHLIGVDLGYEDDNAFVVACYNQYDSHLWIVEVIKRNHLDFYQVSVIIKSLMAKYNTTKVVIDNANKQGVEQMKRRYELPLIAAEKTGKADHIELMNADFITGKILIHEDCTSIMDEYDGLIWDEKKLKKEEHPSCPNHAADAALYMFIHAYNYCFTNRPVYHAPQAEAQVDKFWDMESDKVLRGDRIDEFGF